MALMEVNTAAKRRSKTKQEDDHKSNNFYRRNYTLRGYKLSNLQSDIYTNITIHGETFELEREDGMFYISHPIWSLVGMGEDVIQAVASLFENAKLKAEYYLYEDDSNLSEEAIKFKAYLTNMLS